MWKRNWIYKKRTLIFKKKNENLEKEVTKLNTEKIEISKKLEEILTKINQNGVNLSAEKPVNNFLINNLTPSNRIVNENNQFIHREIDDDNTSGDNISSQNKYNFNKETCWSKWRIRR